jgi:sortase (surface protein transpeptidase)
VTDQAGLAGGAGNSPRRSPPRHRRPPTKRERAQLAGVIMMASGLLAAAFGLGGWAQDGWALGGRATAADGSSYQAGSIHRAAVPHGPVAQAPGPSGRAQVARPVRLVVPSIGVSTKLIRLGLTSSHALQVPPTAAVAGWFTGSPRPGAIGSSVIAGHIDSYLGPGVFYRLSDLRRGEDAYVIGANHTVAVFKITSVRSYLKSRFPTAEVYGPVPDPELRLVTCGGTFDYATRQYLSNVVVYAVLVS